ncbi:hypothetical protein Pmar_PMAR020055 [Perkinsus marinus ATCC 50983]|uniref:PUM-HD domain-containing protein n=2 Tax=Perkinsus marinus (strain ATCC 50983 / TXsc) TaxID=423536 RepID=C5KWK1_PERM5|nr:hypothetical protein Pmar_PMAR020055 [Perkinsus marinus ATCC 50983]EER11076.1 hypothetical protein Pmar_PMAR020055 [Perkinsus marinus ATCC 50983]|eukprot:XP_002779281.1 hypothetical protein Pmar_PMAR020055 [Perkinsus marinus ATCC 50983]
MNPPKEGKYLAERCSLIQGLRGVMEEMTAKGTLTGAEADTLVNIAFEELLAEFDQTPTAERRIVVRNGMIGLYRYNAGEWELTFSYPDFSMQDARSNAISPLGGPSIGLIGTGEPIIKGRRKNKGRGGPHRIPSSIREIFASTERSDSSSDSPMEATADQFGAPGLQSPLSSMATDLSGLQASIWTPKASDRPVRTPGAGGSLTRASDGGQRDSDSTASLQGSVVPSHTPSASVVDPGCWTPGTPPTSWTASGCGHPMIFFPVSLILIRRIVRGLRRAAVAGCTTRCSRMEFQPRKQVIVAGEVVLNGSNLWPSIPLRHGSSNTGYAGSDAASQRTSTTPCSGTFGADVGAGKLKGRGGHNHNSPSVTLEEIQDKILEMAMDRSGSRVLQKLISDTSASAADGGAHDELEKLIDAIIHEIQPVLSRIMCDTYANYMCQQLFQVSSASQRIALLRNVLENIVYISQDRRGTHSLQALIACMQTPQEHALLAETLHGNVNKMALDVHATHVLQQTITKCTPDGPGKEYSHLPMADFGFIFDDIYRNLEALAGDPNGLGVVKKCISHAPWYDDGSYVEKYKSKMLNKLQYFVENPYANYAVQHALEIWGPEVCTDIITKISESIISMAIHKFASNVVETALKVSPDDMRVMLIHRLIDYGNTSCQNAAMITLMNSAYGVFVMSTALRLAPTTELCEQIYGALVRNYQRLPDSRNKQKWDKVLVMAEKRCKKV